MATPMDTTNTGKNQVLDHIDIDATAHEFVNFFYANIKNPQILFTNNIIRNYATFKFNETKYHDKSLIEHITFLSQCNYDIKNMESIDSGTRRIDITVIGTIRYKDSGDKFMSQYFGICHDKNGWFIKNSSLVIIN